MLIYQRVSTTPKVLTHPPTVIKQLSTSEDFHADVPTISKQGPRG